MTPPPTPPQMKNTFGEGGVTEEQKERIGLLTGLEALGAKRWAQIETSKADAGFRGTKKKVVKVRRVRGGVK